MKKDGDGYYIIATSTDLLEFNAGISDDRIPLSANARLTADIDLTKADGNPTEWKPIGYDIDHDYTGIFDGMGHTVKGYKITERADEIGFFGVVYGEVRGLTVSGDINITTDKSKAQAGGVAGYNGGTIEDCVNAGSLTVSADDVQTGGIVGYEYYGTISNCVNRGNITGSHDDNAKTGGIVGNSNFGKILNCSNDGNVTSSGYAGGIIGYGQGNTDYKILNCRNAGEVISTSGNNHTGGIVGYSYCYTISNCINNGKISNSGSGFTGGIAGYSEHSSTILNCLNRGTVLNNYYAGGVAGCKSAGNYSSTISNCGWLKTNEINQNINGVGNDCSDKGTFILDNEDKVNKSVVALSADISEHALNNGDKATISFSTLYGDQKKFSDYVNNIDVKISDPDILSYEVSGDSVILTAKAKGGTKLATTTATIFVDFYATDFSDTNNLPPLDEFTQLSFTFGVTVTNTTKVSGVTITSHDISIYKGEWAQLTAAVEPPEAANLKVSWSSDNPDVVSIDKDSGEMRAIAVGSADITVTTEDGGDDGRQRTDTRTVTVKPANVASVDISPKSLSIDMNDEGRTYELTATVSPDNADYGQVDWTSSNEKVAVVSPDKNDAKALTAYVTPVGKGKTKITASVGDVSADCLITVIPVWAESVTVSPDILTLEAGKSAKLSALVGPEKATDKSVSWKSGDKNIATVSENGEVFAHNPGGPVLITAIANGAKDGTDGTDVRASCSLTVTAPPVPVASVKISPEGAAIKVGESFQFTAKILPENADNKGVTWKSGDEKVATVDANGKVTAVAVGSTAITVTTIDGLKTAEATVSVNKVYSSGSGCAAGVGALALFALLPLWMRRKKR